jgi:hypothetical protein
VPSPNPVLDLRDTFGRVADEPDEVLTLPSKTMSQIGG